MKWKCGVLRFINIRSVIHLENVALDSRRGVCDLLADEIATLRNAKRDGWERGETKNTCCFNTRFTTPCATGTKEM
jgi:hypothetical protein